jgi:hypothetical protein
MYVNGVLYINNIDDFIDFFNGRYGYGSENNPLIINLDTNLDFANKEFYSFPGSTNISDNFYIEFNGLNHTISNLTAHGFNNWCLFGNIVQGFVKDLFLKDIDIISTGNISIVKAIGGDALLENINVSGTLKGTGDVAGITLLSNGANSAIDGCTFSGMMFGNNIIGIVRSQAYTTGRGKVRYCGVTGYFDAINTAYCMCYEQGTIINCEFEGTINSTSISPFCTQTGHAYNCKSKITNISQASIIDTFHRNCELYVY